MFQIHVLAAEGKQENSLKSKTSSLKRKFSARSLELHLPLFAFISPYNCQRLKTSHIQWLARENRLQNLQRKSLLLGVETCEKPKNVGLTVGAPYQKSITV